MRYSLGMWRRGRGRINRHCRRGDRCFHIRLGCEGCRYAELRCNDSGCWSICGFGQDDGRCARIDLGGSVCLGIECCACLSLCIELNCDRSRKNGGRVSCRCEGIRLGGCVGQIIKQYA